jgi:hypothetical protein
VEGGGGACRALAGQALAQMAARAHEDVIAFDALPPMADLLPLHCRTRWFPPWMDVCEALQDVEGCGEETQTTKEEGGGGTPDPVDVGAGLSTNLADLMQGMQGFWSGGGGQEGGGAEEGGGEGGRGEWGVLLVWDVSVMGRGVKGREGGSGAGGRRAGCWEEVLNVALTAVSSCSGHVTGGHRLHGTARASAAESAIESGEEEDLHVLGGSASPSTPPPPPVPLTVVVVGTGGAVLGAGGGGGRESAHDVGVGIGEEAEAVRRYIESTLAFGGGGGGGGESRTWCMWIWRRRRGLCGLCR